MHLGMPLPVLTPVQRADALESAASDLRYLLSDLGVPDDIQIAFYYGGFTTMGLFATLDRTEEGVRDFLRLEFDIEAIANLAARRLVALIINAWEAAKDQKAKENQLRAEERLTSSRPRPVSGNDFTAMRKVYEARHGKVCLLYTSDAADE